MTTYFNPSNNGFYSDAFHGPRTLRVPDPAWTPSADVDDAVAPLIDSPNPACTLPPADALIPLTDTAYAALITGQSRGQLIALVDGKPLLIDPPSRTADEVLASAMRERDRRLTEAATRLAPLQDAADLGEATDTESAALLAWKRYRVAVNRVDLGTVSIAWPDAPDQPDSPSITNEV